MSKVVVPNIKKHVRVCGDAHTYCGHPVEAGEIFNFGNGEIACMHLHTDNVTYTDDTALWHGQTGIHATAKIIMDRSFDGGYTWPVEAKTVVFDQGRSIEEQRELLSHNATEQNMPSVTPNTIFHFGKSFSGEDIGEGRHMITPYAVRSEDKGKTWSREVISPDNLGYTLFQACSTIIRQGDVFYKPFVVCTQPGVDNNTADSVSYVVLYKSENNGVTWQYVSDVARDPYAECSHSYLSVLDLGDGHFFAITGCWRGHFHRTRWISGIDSYDNGLNWTVPRRIQSFGVSPYPLQLHDGRIVIIYVRRYPDSKRGVYGILSGDQGKTWSEEFCLRNDASGGDIGYPVATQLENGDIFTSYYYMVADGQPRGGARHIAGTIFSV